MSDFDPAELPILVVSCDKYQDLWRIFFHLFFKYWPDCPFPVYLVSNTLAYNHPRVRTLLVGPDEGYSTNLIKALRLVPAEWVLFWIDDRPPCSPVDSNELLDLIRLARKRNAVYLQLLSFHPYALVPRTEKIGEISKRARYLVSLTISLWKRETFLKILAPGESAWDIEKKGGRARAAALTEPFFSLSIDRRSCAPIRDLHLITKGRITREALAFLKREHLEMVPGVRRPVTFHYHIYIQLVRFCWNVHYSLRWSILKALHRLNPISSRPF